jgi:hypothetical protein
VRALGEQRSERRAALASCSRALGRTQFGFHARETGKKRISQIARKGRHSGTVARTKTRWGLQTRRDKVGHAPRQEALNARSAETEIGLVRDEYRNKSDPEYGAKDHQAAFVEATRED